MAESKGYIDADGHVRDGATQMRKYIATKYQNRQGSGAGAGDSFDRQKNGSLGGPRELDAANWLEQLDMGGIETTVLYPTGGLGINFIHETEYAIEFSKAYNNYISEEFVKVSPRLKAVAILSLQDPDEAAKELRRAVTELDLSGAMLAADGPFLLGKKFMDPIYAEAERLNVPVTIHAAGNLKGRGLDEYLFDRLLHAHVLSHSGAQMRQMTSIIYEGVLERFPTINIAFLEAGCTWVPYWMDRMDEEFEFRGAEEAPLLKKKPSDYIRSDNVYVACEPGEQLLPETLRIIGEGSVVYATDYPHWDASYPDSLYELEARKDITDEQKHKILIDNPKALYHL